MAWKHIDLTDEQHELVKRLCAWYRSPSSPQWFSYTGAAGTGKTTVIKSFIEELDLKDYIAVAYVGKAVTVLSRHGLPASTIHSLIYQVEWVEQKDAEGFPIYKPNGEPKMKVEFHLKPNLTSGLELIIVDEATMVNDDLAEDILSFGVKTIFIGDMNQLPPVFGVSSVMAMPNFRLTKIMRQAEDDPIVYLSQCVLNHKPIPYGSYGKCRVMPQIRLGENFRDYDAIITARNRTRDNINHYIREEVLGIRNPLPVIGDKVICRQNNWERSIEGNIFLTNGLAGVVTDIHRSLSGGRFLSIDFQPDISDEEFFNLQIDANYIKMDYEERKNHGFTQFEKFEYAYAITTHSSQGSEYPRVLFIDQWFGDAEMTRKVEYTSITRAEESIDIAMDIIFETRMNQPSFYRPLSLDDSQS